MAIAEILATKRRHLARLANEGGAAGESSAIAAAVNWVPRPTGKALKALLAALAEKSLRDALGEMVFIESKSASQSRVKAGFGGFFFALTESEIVAADQLGARHRVALFNRLTWEVLLTSIPEILARSRSMTWQLSVQL